MKNPLLWIAVAIGALWYFNRRSNPTGVVRRQGLGTQRQYNFRHAPKGSTKIIGAGFDSNNVKPEAAVNPNVFR